MAALAAFAKATAAKCARTRPPKPWHRREAATQSARVREPEDLFKRWVAGSSPAMVNFWGRADIDDRLGDAFARYRYEPAGHDS
jgi:hypothetical protein